MTHRHKHFLTQPQLTGSDLGFWQRGSFDVPENIIVSELRLELGQHENYRFRSDFLEAKLVMADLSTDMSFVKENLNGMKR